MTRYFFQAILIFSAALLFQACTDEEPAPINFRKADKPLLDTTYMAAAPAPESKHVILIDITGVRCNNCPQAADKAKAIEASRSGRVHIVAAYVRSMPNLTAPWAGNDTLTTVAADQMIGATGVSINSLPNGMVDQAVFGSSRVLGVNEWEARVNERLALTTPLNIALSSTWDNAKGEALITLRLHYTADQGAGNQRFTIALTEDGIIGKQSDRDTSGGIRYFYTHNRVLRTTITAASGELLNASLVAGRVFEKQYRYKPANGFKPENMRVVAFVQQDDDKTIIHGKEAKLKP
jgi:hypothetical protein